MLIGWFSACVFGVFACVPDSFMLVYLNTWLARMLALVSGETLLQEKNSTGRRWDSNPGPWR